MEQKKRRHIKDNLISAMISLTIWSVIVIAVCLAFIQNHFWIGPIMLILGILMTLSIWFFNHSYHSILPDILFGSIDNGVLVIFAIVGANFFGVLGAIIGGAVGNAVSDGFAGVIEGHSSKKLTHKGKDTERTSIRSGLGKMAGCLIASGIVLIIAWTILGL